MLRLKVQHYHSLLPAGIRVFPGVVLVLLLLLAGLADAHTQPQPVAAAAYLLEQADVIQPAEVKAGEEAQFTRLPTEPHCHEEYRHQPDLVLPQRNANPNDDPDADSQANLATYPPFHKYLPLRSPDWKRFIPRSSAIYLLTQRFRS